MSAGQEQLSLFPPIVERAVRQAVAKELLICRNLEGQEFVNSFKIGIRLALPFKTAVAMDQKIVTIVSAS